MRTLEPRPHTLHGCYVLLKYFEDTLGQIFSGFYGSIVGHQGDGYVDPLLAVYQPCLLKQHWLVAVKTFLEQFNFFKIMFIVVLKQ